MKNKIWIILIMFSTFLHAENDMDIKKNKNVSESEVQLIESEKNNIEKKENNEKKEYEEENKVEEENKIIENKNEIIENNNLKKEQEIEKKVKYFTQQEIEDILKSNKKVDKVESIKVNGAKITIEGLYIRKVRIERIYTDLDMKISEVIITKKDLEESIVRKNKDVKEIDITIKKGYLIAEGKAQLLGVMNTMELEGSFYINKNKEIYYSLTKAKVKKIIPVPKNILDKFDKKINPFFKLDELGITLYLSNLIFEKDRIIVR